MVMDTQRKDVICESNNIKERWSYMGAHLCLILKLSQNQFKLHCYKFRRLNAILTVTTKEISKKYTQKAMKGETNGLLQKKIKYTQKRQKKKDKKSYQTYRKQMAKRQE